MMEEKNDNRMNRRGFFKTLGTAGVATAALAGLPGCDGQKNRTTTAGSRQPGEMTYRTSPTTGDRVSLLGYGCMRWPMRPKEGGKEGEEEVDQAAVNAMVDYAIQHGVNYFDTSPAYVRGLSETVTGIALSRHPRDKYFIATKMSNFSPDTQTLQGAVALYRHSMEALQVDYLDYYLMHAVGLGGMEALGQRFLNNGVLDFLLKEREAGRIRNLGFSYHGDVKVFDYLLEHHDKYKWDFVQIELNYMDWKHASGWNTNAEYLYAELEKRGIPAVVMEPLLGGRLSNMPDHLAARLKQRRPEESVASWAFRFAGSFPNILTVLSGMTYMEHVQDNVLTYSPLDPCTEEELALLEDTAQTMLKYPSVPCTACQYCMPCPYGLDIPGIFAHYNRCINEGNVPEGTQDENYRRARRAFLVGYDRSVPRLRQANHCIGCKQCEHHCPQSIKISDQLHRIDQFVEQLKQGTLSTEI